MSQAVPLPKMGLTMEEATLVKWHKKIGDLVKKSEILLEIETDKSILEIEAPLSGLLMDQRYQEGDVIPVSAVICHIGQTNQPGVPGDRTDYVPDPNDIPENKTRILLSPAARRKARELGLKVEDLQSLPGSGPSNRIVLKDLELYSSKMNRQSNEQDHMPISNFQSTDQNNHIVVLNNIRSITARKLTASFRDVPQFTIKRRVDLSNINKIRNTFQSIGIKLSINDFSFRQRQERWRKMNSSMPAFPNQRMN
jgi:pyruvate dehydrogenase E2 component (dihydrolipoamide acetyltransferase)